MPGQGQRLVADALHQAAVAAENVGVVVDDVVAELCREQPFGERHADRIAEALATREKAARHGDLIVSLYNQKELWPKFGYEGSSAEHGGYIKRGFADIDWLPKA